MEQFLTYLYMFRDNLYNQIIDESAESINLILKKIQVYRTYIFIQFFTDLVKPELEKQTSIVGNKLNDLLNSSTPREEFALASLLIRKDQLPQPDPDQLLKKWTRRQRNHSRNLRELVSKRLYPSHLPEAERSRSKVLHLRKRASDVGRARSSSARFPQGF